MTGVQTCALPISKSAFGGVEDNQEDLNVEVQDTADTPTDEQA